MRANSLLPVVIVLGQILGGCTALPDGESVAAASRERVTRSSEAIGTQGQRLTEPLERDDSAEGPALAKALLEERRDLFDQPYIDPLTRYLETHGEDPRYAEVLTDILRERGRRCAVIADEYTERPVSRETLARYRRGYLYSCPADVNAFYARVREQEARRAVTAPEPERKEPESEPAEESEGAPGPEAVYASIASLAGRDKQVEEALSRRKRNDCYLLFTIRNLGEAREACRTPAEQDDPRAQRHMGSMAELKGNREEAVRWYRRAVDNGDVKAGERLEALTATILDATDLDADTDAESVQ